jgi:hypothetical protein
LITGGRSCHLRVETPPFSHPRGEHTLLFRRTEWRPEGVWAHLNNKCTFLSRITYLLKIVFKIYTAFSMYAYLSTYIHLPGNI